MYPKEDKVYEDAKFSGYSTTIDARPQTIRPEPQAPSALAGLSEASARYAKAAEAFIVARFALMDARSEWDAARDRVAKATEAEGV